MTDLGYSLEQLKSWPTMGCMGWLKKVGPSILLLASMLCVSNSSKALSPASALSNGGTINRADINRDGSVGGPDLTALLSAWGTNDANADINQDETVNGSDMTNLLTAWSN